MYRNILNLKILTTRFLDCELLRKDREQRVKNGRKTFIELYGSAVPGKLAPVLSVAKGDKMKQPTAFFSLKGINKIIRRDYSIYPIKDILKELNKYSDYEKYRVWAGILKLSNGNMNRLKKNVIKANNDYRDILAYSEYPEYSDKIGFDDDKFTRKELNEIIKRDKQQLDIWRKRK